MELFDETLQGLQEFIVFFEDSLPSNALKSFQLPMMEDFSILVAHTGYFTSCCDYFSPIIQIFGIGIDPNRDLEMLKGSHFVHTEDNIVQYLGEMEKNKEISYIINL